jgi:hypothetical protein
LIFSIGLIIWRFKLMPNNNPNTDLLLQLWAKMGSDEKYQHKNDPVR